MRSYRMVERRFPLGPLSPQWITVLLICAAILAAPNARAQTTEGQEADRAHAIELFQQGKYLDALPLLEKLAGQRPSDMVVHALLGSCLVAKVATVDDAEERKKERLRARTVLLEAQKLGDKSPLTQILLDQIPPDGNVSPFSARKDVDEAMKEGEAAFAKGDLDQARAAYSRALLLYPKEYEAALFTGDVYFKQQEMGTAGEWFDRAVQINPDRETAYRYWGDSLLSSNQTKDARAKYIEAIIAEPYNRAPWMGVSNWTTRKQVKLTFPRIQSPHQVSVKDGTPNITIDAKSLPDKDGTLSWLVYEITCKAWKDELFAKEFPAEKTYRHSLPEEAAALRQVAKAVRVEVKDGKVESLDSGLATLIKLDDQGLLEAYILLSRADQGIAQDYAAYRAANREKLRQYLDQYVVPAD